MRNHIVLRNRISCIKLVGLQFPNDINGNLYDFTFTLLLLCYYFETGAKVIKNNISYFTQVQYH